MLILFKNYFDLPVNILVWCFLSTFYPSIFFAIYAPNNSWKTINEK